MARTHFVLASVVVGLLAAGSGARAEEEFLRIPLAEKDLPAPHTQWYGMYMNGTKCGFLRAELGRTGDGTGAACFVEMRGTIRLKSMGQELEMDLVERTEFDAAAPFAFRAGLSSMKQQGGEQRVEVARAGKGLSAKVAAGGETRTLEVPAPDYTLADYLTGERWVAAGRAAGDRARVRSFSVSDLEPDADALTVLARKESLVGGVRTAFYEVETTSERKGHVGVVRLDAAGRLLSMQMGGLFEVRLEPEETARRIESGSDLFVFGMAKIDRPLGDPTQVRRLVVEVSGEGTTQLADGARQDVERDGATGTTTLSLGAEFGGTVTASAAESEKALAETVDHPTRLPQVTALAAQAVGDAKTPREKVERLVRFVAEYVQDVEMPRMLSVSEIIAGKRGDCSEHATLFTTLARAAGVPAREVGGLMYMGDDVLAFGGHAWAEVVLDGKWVPVDPTWNQTELDATHVTLQREGNAMGFLSALGRLEFRLKEAKAAK